MILLRDFKDIVKVIKIEIDITTKVIIDSVIIKYISLFASLKISFELTPPTKSQFHSSKFSNTVNFSSSFQIYVRSPFLLFKISFII